MSRYNSNCNSYNGPPPHANIPPLPLPPNQTFCRCRCPCHEAGKSHPVTSPEPETRGQTENTIAPLAQESAKGMKWAQGAVRNTVPVGVKQTQTPVAAPRKVQIDAPEPKASNLGPEGSNTMASECISKSLLHVKNMVKTMTYRWERESMSEPVDDHSFARRNQQCFASRKCAACTSSHKHFEPVAAAGTGTNSIAERRRSSPDQECFDCVQSALHRKKRQDSFELKLNEKQKPGAGKKGHQIDGGNHQCNHYDEGSQKDENEIHHPSDFLRTGENNEIEMGGKSVAVDVEDEKRKTQNGDPVDVSIQTNEWFRTEMNFTLCSGGGGGPIHEETDDDVDGAPIDYDDPHHNPELNGGDEETGKVHDKDFDEPRDEQYCFHEEALELETAAEIPKKYQSPPPKRDSDHLECGDEAMKIDDDAHSKREMKMSSESIKLRKEDQSHKGSLEVESFGNCIMETGEGEETKAKIEIEETKSTYLAWITLPKLDENLCNRTRDLVEKEIQVGDDEYSRNGGKCATTKTTKDPVLAHLSEDFDSVTVTKSQVKMENVSRSKSLLNVVAKSLSSEKHRAVPAGPSQVEKGKLSRTERMMAMSCSTKLFYICQGCHKIVEKAEGVFYLVGGVYTAWHPKCFKCHKCDKELTENNNCFFDDLPYCSEHFLSVVNIPKCAECQELIFDLSFTTAGGKYFHTEHFTCHLCKRILENTRFVLVSDVPYCFPCHERTFPKECQSCHKRISLQEPYFQHGPYVWHLNDCLRCSTCDGKLVSRDLVFRRGGQLYCNRYCAVRET